MHLKKSKAVPLYHVKMNEFHNLAAHLINKHPEHVNARIEQKNAMMHAVMNTMQMITDLQSIVKIWLTQLPYIGLLPIKHSILGCLFDYGTDINA